MSNKIDTTGATLTPEMAQKGEQVADKAAEDAKAEAQAKADADAKAEADKKAADDAEKAQKDADAKAEADKKGKSDLPEKKRSIYDDLKEKKQEVRAAKSEAEIVKAENEALKAELAAVKELAESAKKAKTPEEKEAIEDDIKEIAEAIGGDAKAIKTLTDFLTKKLVKTGTVDISKEDIEAVKNFRKEQSKMNADVEFTKEWDEFTPSLKKDFPHISDADLKTVKQKLFDLAHSTKYHDKEMDYIYFKNKDILSKLVSPKRPSMESAGDSKPDDGAKAISEISSKSSPMDVQNTVQRDRHTPSSYEIRKSK
jgi:hypothetical protein